MARSFYEDDDKVLTTPGVNTPMPSKLEEEEKLHGNHSFVQGMVVRTSPVIETYTKELRKWLHDKYAIYGAEWETQKSLFNNEWNNVKREVAQTVADPVLPNLIYILTAALTGSILVNRRLLPTRFIVPVITGGAATAYFMPNTFRNLDKKLDQFEAQVAPQFHQERERFVNEDVKGFEDEFKRGIRYANGALQMSIHDARLKVALLFSDEK